MLMFLAAASPMSWGGDPVALDFQPEILTFRPLVQAERYELRLRGPAEVYRQMAFQGNSIPYVEPYDALGKPLPDGAYVYELRFTMPVIEGKTAKRPAPMTGQFFIRDGHFVDANPESRDLVNLNDLGVFPRPYGQLGLGTAVPDPQTQIHLSSESDPRLRLERLADGDVGNVTWDLWSGPSGFALENRVQQTNHQPFFIANRAPDGSLYIGGDGEIGMGTATPAARLDLVDDGDGDVLHVQNNANTERRRNVLTLENQGEVAFQMRMNPTGDVWSFLVRAEDFLISRNGSRAEELRIGEDGTLYTHGSINPKSDAASKHVFEDVPAEDVLDAVGNLPIQSWSYKHDPKGTRHLGPTAQDFREAFQLGADDGSISLVDSSGVALSAIKALRERLLQKDRELNEVHAKNRELESRLASLESKMAALLDQKQP